MTKPNLKLVTNTLRRTRTLPPVQPDKRLSFNDWQKHLQTEREKFAPKYVEARIVKLKKRA